VPGYYKMKQKAESLETELKTAMKQQEDQTLISKMTSQVSSLLAAAGIRAQASSPTSAHAGGNAGGGSSSAAPPTAQGAFRHRVHRLRSVCPVGVRHSVALCSLLCPRWVCPPR
jgi:hypothetical protein